MAQLFRDLGWPETAESDEHHRTFQCTNGCVIGLFAASNYEPHFGPPADSFRAFTLCVNLESLAEVEAVHETLKGVAGVELLEEPTERSGAAASAGATRKATSGTWRGPKARASTTAAA